MTSRCQPSLNRSMPKLLLLLLLIGSLSACGGGGGWDMPPPVVETKPALTQAWMVTYETTGTIEANNRVDLNTETSGTITQIHVREGQTVGRGQILMRLKADKALAQVQQSVAGVASSRQGLEVQKADIQQAQARLNAVEQRRKLAQFEAQRFEKLYNDQFISQWELEQKRTNLDTALAAYNEALEQLSAAKARYQQASTSVSQAQSSLTYNRALASETVIRAPFSGVVGQKYVDLGDYVLPSEKLVTVVDPSQFKIEFEVPERFLGQLKPGLPVTVKFEGLGQTPFSAQVQFIDPAVDRDAHTVTVKAVVQDRANQLRDGLFGTVALSLGAIPNAVVVPEESVFPQGEKNFVYVVQAGKAFMREVHVGHRSAGWVQLDAGLKPGEKVIVNGLQKVMDGQPVNDSGLKPIAKPKGH